MQVPRRMENPLNRSTPQPLNHKKNREEKIEFSSRVEVIGLELRNSSVARYANELMFLFLRGRLFLGGSFLCFFLSCHGD
jgi:hypothetical protein